MSRDSQKARTRGALVETARQLIAGGKRPTVTEVADAADISRRTAYRYFPNAEQLSIEAILESLRSDVEGEIDAAAPGDDIRARVDRLVDALHRLTVDNEDLLRQMIRFTVDRGPIEAGVPPRPARRLEYVEQALAPLLDQLSATHRDRLVNAFAVVIGIEATIVLRDICGLADDEVVETQRWAAQALLRAGLASASATTRTRS